MPMFTRAAGANPNLVIRPHLDGYLMSGQWPDDLDLEGFKKKKPGYWAQQQDYMRMSGLPMTVLIFMQTGYPYDVREFHIPADPKFQEETAQKYALALECAETVYQPPPCCWPG